MLEGIAAIAVMTATNLISSYTIAAASPVSIDATVSTTSLSFH